MAEESTVPQPEKVKGKGISTYIKSLFIDLGVEQALSFEDVVKNVREKFPHVKDSTSASARVNLVLKQKKVARDFKKIKSPKDNKIYIVRKSEQEKQLEAFQQESAPTAPPPETPAAPVTQ